MKTFKNILKTLVVGTLIGLFALPSEVKAYTVLATNLPAPLANQSGRTNLLLQGSGQLFEIDVAAGTNAGSVPVVLSFYDGTNTNQLYYVYSNNIVTATQVLTNVTDVITNGVGAIQTNLYPGTYTVFTTNGAGTNFALPPLYATAVSPGQYVRYTNLRILYQAGLMVVENTNNVALTIFYGPLL